MRLFLILAVGFSSHAFAANHFCANQVKAPAAKLFALHYELGQLEAIKAISDEVTALAPVKSPDGKRMYSVLETTATIGKMGLYRIRMIYALLGHDDPSKDCVLMGQEILDMSVL